MTDPRICLGIPSSELIHARFMISLLHLLQASKHLTINSINYRSSRIAANRNEIVKFAKEQKSTHVMFLDSDMTFPPYGLNELLKHDKDIVCATATKREEGEGAPIGTPLTMGDAVTSERMIRMQFVGMPFMLIKMGVFEKLPELPFAEPIVDGSLMPEDEYFCRAVIKEGFEIWCDLALSAQMGHMGVKEYKIAQPKEPQLRLVKVA